jgi:uncharacterized protein with HEPN domain
MQAEDRDAAYLWDLVEAAKTIRQFTEKLKFKDYEKNRMLQLAVERELEVIGEAARNLSQNFKDAHPELPWARIIAQRNVLAHEYGDIRQDRIWQVVTTRVPELILVLEPLIPKLPPDSKG